MARLDGQGLRRSRARRAASAPRPRGGSSEEGATVVGVDLRDDSRRRPRARLRRRRRGRGRATMYERVRDRVRPHRRAVQQRRHLPARGRLRARDRARGLAARAGRQPQVRLPLLQARHPAPARRRGGGSVINTASFVAVMGAATSQISYTASKGGVLVALARARRGVRPPGRARQRALPRPGQHAAAAGAVRQGPREGRAGGSCTCRWGASPRPSRSPTRRCSWPRDESSYVTAVDVPRRRRHLRRLHDADQRE